MSLLPDTGLSFLMSGMKRPLTVTVLACLYLLVGIVGFVHHVPERHQHDWIWIALTEFLADLSGAFMLLGHNWARWLAVAWIAFHVVLSFPALQPFIMHLVFLIAIAYPLFRRESTRYFRRGTADGA